MRSSERAANSGHLSPVGRGRPSAARSGEGGPSSPASSTPPHPTPLPAAGERENATASSQSAAAAGHGIALEPALAAYLHAVAANFVSAGVRLIPLGQTDGQRVIASLEPLIAAAACRALATTLDEMGSAAFRADLASQRHEAQY